MPVTWSFRQCGASGQAGRAPQGAALGSLGQEAVQQETGLERPSGVLAALEWRADGAVEGAGGQAESTAQSVRPRVQGSRRGVGRQRSCVLLWRGVGQEARKDQSLQRLTVSVFPFLGSSREPGGPRTHSTPVHVTPRPLAPTSC